MNKILSEILLIIFLIGIAVMFWSYYNNIFMTSQRAVDIQVSYE